MTTIQDVIEFIKQGQDQFSGCDWETGREGEEHARYIDAVEHSAQLADDAGDSAIKYLRESEETGRIYGANRALVLLNYCVSEERRWGDATAYTQALCALEQALAEPNNLDELVARIRFCDDLDLSDLPTFGGEAPSDTLGVYSWDEHYILTDSLAIIER